MHRQHFLVIALCAMLALTSVQAVWAQGPEKLGDSANGYSLLQFGNFLKDWHFVTSRFREDTGEMRLTYANDIAWEALLAGKSDYPDGAVFAKIGVRTLPDPAFASSAEPSGAKRFQLMIHDSKKHADTDGWGYALFNMDGGPMEKNFDFTNACHTCHELVPERGYVFSRVMQLEIGRTALNEMLSSEGTPRIQFVEKPVSEAPEKMRAYIPEGATKIRLVTGPMTENLFQGTLDEIRPTLADETSRTGIPTALVSKKGDMFVILHMDKDTKCDFPDGRKGITVKGAFTSNVASGKKIITEIDYCKD